MILDLDIGRNLYQMEMVVMKQLIDMKIVA